MFFNTTNEENILKIYTTERPYSLQYKHSESDQNDNFVPTILSDLMQIVTLFTTNKLDALMQVDSYIKLNSTMFKESSFEKDVLLNSQPIYEVLNGDRAVELHHTMRELCERSHIINTHIETNESRWDSFIEIQLEKLQNSDFTNVNLTDLAFIINQHFNFNQHLYDRLKIGELVKTQLINSGDLIRKYAYKELEAYENDEIMFCRFTHKGHRHEIDKCKDYKYPYSFGDSLLSGYVLDGITHSDLLNTKLLSACTFNYYDVYRQGIELLKDGGIKNIKNKKPEQLEIIEKYLKHIPTNELYIIKFDNEKLEELQQIEDQIYIPGEYFTMSSAACFGNGELFHPRISMLEEFAPLIDIIPFNSNNINDF